MVPLFFCPVKGAHSAMLPGLGSSSLRTLGSGDSRKPVRQHLGARVLPRCLTPPPPASPPRNAVNAKADSCPNQLLPLYSICLHSSLPKAWLEKPDGSVGR